MPAFTIPTQPDSTWSQTTQLDGVEYTLRFQYNDREKNYRLSLADPLTGNDIITGVKLVSNWLLIGRYRGIGNLPPGDFAAVTNDNTDTPATLGDLAPNGRVTLYYFDATFLATGV